MELVRQELGVPRAAGEGLGLGLARSGCSEAGKWGCLTGECTRHADHGQIHPHTVD